jgi:hypothetical protein
MMNTMSLSVVINTKNSAVTLKKALDSVKSLADEIVIVDMRSTDETLSIAKKYTQKISSFNDVGYVEPARNFAISKATKDWVLVLDADEEVSDGLRQIIKQIISGQVDINGQADAYFIPRQNIIFNKKIEKTGWWPDYQLRLFKTGAVKWSDEIHSIPEVLGNTLSLPADDRFAIIHHNYQTVEQFVERLNRYTTAHLVTKNADDKSTPLTTAQLLETFTKELTSRLFAQKGIDEGVHGLGLSLMQSMYQVVVELKKWQNAGFPVSGNDQIETLSVIQAWQEELFFWIADWHVQHSSGLAKVIWKIRRRLRV